MPMSARWRHSCLPFKQARTPRSPSLSRDRTLWPTLESLLDDRDSEALPGPTPFRRWILLRRLRLAVWNRDWIAATLVTAVLNGFGDKAASVEINTAQAYLQALAGDRDAAKRAAQRAFGRNRRSEALQTNLDLVSGRHELRCLNPYLLLGLPTGIQNVDAWRCRYKGCWRAEGDLVEEFNWANHELSTGARGPWFTYPVKEVLYQNPRARDGLLSPPALPLPRRSQRLDPEALARLRLAAARDVVQLSIKALNRAEVSCDVTSNLDSGVRP